MASSIGTFKTAWKARLAADATLTAAGVYVSLGNPYPGGMRVKDLVMVGDATPEPGQEPVGIGSDFREEKYEIEMVVSCIRPAQELYSDIEAAAFVIFNAVEASLIAWRSVASPYGGLNGWAYISNVGTREAFTRDADGKVIERECGIIFAVMVTARI